MSFSVSFVVKKDRRIAHRVHFIFLFQNLFNELPTLTHLRNHSVESKHDLAISVIPSSMHLC